jgi:hypothetical protein
MLNVYSVDGNVVVETEENSMIDVYSLVSQHLVSVKAESGFTTIPMIEDNNVVIVKVGGQAQKVMIK